jgi:hypothetical protein
VILVCQQRVKFFSEHSGERVELAVALPHTGVHGFDHAGLPDQDDRGRRGDTERAGG